MGKLLTKKERRKKAAKNYRSPVNGYKKNLRRAVSKATGKYFTGEFVCDLCRHTRFIGYVYDIDNVEYEICKFCNNSIHGKHDYVKIIYTPMCS